MNAPIAEKSSWLTPKELRGRYAEHLSKAGLFKRLAHPRCPLFQARRGPKGRLNEIKATPKLIAFLQLRAEPGLSLPGVPLNPHHQPRTYHE